MTKDELALSMENNPNKPQKFFLVKHLHGAKVCRLCPGIGNIPKDLHAVFSFYCFTEENQGSEV